MKKQKPDLTRRQFLTGMTAVLGGLVLSQIQEITARAQAWPRRLFMPLVEERSFSPAASEPTPISTQRAAIPLTNHAVIHVRHPKAAPTYTQTQPFYTVVDQASVDGMALRGLQELTGKTGWGEIWTVLFGRVTPGGYQSGAIVAIKVNFNNTARNGNTAASHNSDIDALPQPILALIKGMVQHAGVNPANIYIYDASHTYADTVEVGRLFPKYFTDRIHAVYPAVKFIGLEGYNGALKPTYGKDASLTVTFTNGVEPRKLADILFDATYVINVPILKMHQRSAEIPLNHFTSLGLKNHVGSLHYVLGDGNDHLHNYITNGDLSQYVRSYNPLVEIAKNSNLRNKTILVMGDALYGSKWGAVSGAEANWAIFGGQPASSLFFAVDPIAIDCVMTDVLMDELNRAAPLNRAQTAAYDALFLGQEAGLGYCEGTRNAPGGKPFQAPYGSGYNKIPFKRIDLS